jgi:O-antigen ligase
MRARFAPGDGAALAPSQAWLVVHTSILVAFSSWAFGGGYDWGPLAILALTLLGLPLVALRARESGSIHLASFLPSLLWVGFCGAALLNPSYFHNPDIGWVPNPRWISWLPATADVDHTLLGAPAWLAALLEGALLVSVLRSTRAARAIVGFAAINGFILAAVGAFFFFSGADQALGCVEVPEPTYFFATFFYKNHWAVFGAVSAIAASSLVLSKASSAMSGDPRSTGRLLLFGAAGLLTLITLPLPGSRSGVALAVVIVLATACGLMLMVWRRNRTQVPSAPVGKWLLAAIFAGAALAIGFGVDAYAPKAEADLQRTEYQFEHRADGTLDLRVLLSRDTWHMARSRPMFGWGPGAFEVVFPRFRGSYLRDANGRPTARIQTAHDDWLQLLAECGFVGAAIIVLPALLLWWRSWKTGSAPGRWGLVLLGVIAIYAVGDFPFQNPAILILWTVLLVAVRRV